MKSKKPTEKEQKLETELAELKAAARKVLPTLYRAVEFIPYSDPERKAYHALNELAGESQDNY